MILESSDQDDALNAARANAVAELNQLAPNSAVFVETNGLIGQDWGNNRNGESWNDTLDFHFDGKAENFLELGWLAGQAILATDQNEDDDSDSDNDIHADEVGEEATQLEWSVNQEADVPLAEAMASSRIDTTTDRDVFVLDRLFERLSVSLAANDSESSMQFEFTVYDQNAELLEADESGEFDVSSTELIYVAIDGDGTGSYILEVLNSGVAEEDDDHEDGDDEEHEDDEVIDDEDEEGEDEDYEDDDSETVEDYDVAEDDSDTGEDDVEADDDFDACEDHDEADDEFATDDTYSGDNAAVELDRSLNLRTTGNYFENWLGLGEKWIWGSGDWHYITPNGQFYRWGRGGETDELLTSLSPEFSANPTLLTTASEQATLSAPDGALMREAVRLDTELGLRSTSNTFENWMGKQERWLWGTAGWYYMTPDGALYIWARGTSNGNLVGQLDNRFYENLGMLTAASEADSMDELFASLAVSGLTI